MSKPWSKSVTELPSRDQLASMYFEQLPFEPYPVQEEALLAWFTCQQGVLVCAPTGTGKTLIAEAAVFEALHSGTSAYYTTPLIALTEQKYRELQEAAVRWGFSAKDVGLVTGNRRVNPDARILVVVAEILFNRLLHREVFDFQDVAAVVMDEFHSFNDPERGIVWELSLGLLPPHVRTLLLSATVGNAREFCNWLNHCHHRRVELVQSDQRKVPLTYQWVGDALLSEHLEWMASGDEESRKTPALVFCFNREECWNVAEQLKGKSVVRRAQQAQLAEELQQYDWSEGAGPKLKQILLRGVGVHHAGVLPKYRRIVEDLFQRKLLSVTVCTETLAAGINLPARSVVIPNLLKGPPDKKRLIDASSAHQMFGRAGRPQFDTQGFVFALAHEDDVKILRWREKYDTIPEDTKDPQLRKAKRALKKKMPTRRSTHQYWTEGQFDQLRKASPSKLYSKGPLPWRLLAYMLDASSDVEPIRQLVGKRLMDSKRQQAGQLALDRMLITLWTGGYVKLDPEPPRSPAADNPPATFASTVRDTGNEQQNMDQSESGYRPLRAEPTPEMQKLLMLRGVNPLYGVFLINQLGIADRAERIQALESVLDLPRSVGPAIHVPGPDELPPGPLATLRLDEQLLKLGLATAEEITGSTADEDDRHRLFSEERVWPLTLAEKLRRLFNYDFPAVHDVISQPVWVAGELLEFGGDFNKYVTANRLQKQEGIVFRHLLRLILLVLEVAEIVPVDCEPREWKADLADLARRLTESCRSVDPLSTDKALEDAPAIAVNSA